MIGIATGFVLGAEDVVFAKKKDRDSRKRNPAQDRRLSDSEIKRVQDYAGGREGLDAVKGGKNASKRDIFVDPHTGDLYVKPKNGSDPGEPTGINFNNLFWG